MHKILRLSFQRLKEQNATSRMFLHGLDLTKVHKNQQHHSTIGYLPIINLPAHENDTFWTVMMRTLQISHAKNPGQSTVLSFDEQLYCKAKELQWKNPEICKQLVLRLGGFHIFLNYLKVIGKHWKNTGLEHVWVESSVYGENTANNSMDGKSYIEQSVLTSLPMMHCGEFSGLSF